MDFLSAEIDNLKKRAPNKRYIKRGEIEAQRVAKYEAEQEAIREKKRLRDHEKLEKLREYESSKRRKTEQLDSSKEEPKETVEQAIEGLCGLHEPVRLFAETDDEVIERWLKVKRARETSQIAVVDVFLDPPDNELPTKESLTLDDKAIGTDKQQELCRCLFLLLRLFLRDWEGAMKTSTDARTIQNFETSKVHLSRLLQRLQGNNLPKDILRNLTNAVRGLQTRDYTAANHAYLQMSIGKATWPVGVSFSTIHERAFKERQRPDLDKAHILSDEQTRQWLQSFKRLITFCESTLNG